MQEHLCISIRFLDGAFHGRADRGEPEWPPSPLRLFQALVAASAARWNERRGIRHAASALRWLEHLPPPVIVAPAIAAGATYRLYVPDNVGDLVGKSWSRGNEASMANYRAEKIVAPSRLRDADGVHYCWPLEGNDITPHREVIETAARSVTHLGWGVDMVVAEASLVGDSEIGNLPGERWISFEGDGGTRLRIPCAGTLENLERRHQQFLERVQGDRFSPVAPLSVFALSSYRRDNEPEPPPSALFALRRLDGSAFRPFDATRKGLIVSGMLRHAASDSRIAGGVGWSQEQIRHLVLGHGEDRGGSREPVNGARIVFLPLPTIEPRGEQENPAIGSIRRALVTVRGNVSRAEFRSFVQRLAGRELVDEETGSPVALLARVPEMDAVTHHYTRTAATWATVTPVVLPGHDDPRKLRQRLRPNEELGLTAEQKKDVLSKLNHRIESLLRKAIRQAGFSDELAACADLDWRSTGFWPGTELASRYAIPRQHRRYRRLHVKITWRGARGDPVRVRGPVCLGGGKFIGLGLFAALPNPAA